MADFTALKEAIQDAIKQNGQKEITGEVLQTILLSMVSTLGDSAINNLIDALATAVTTLQNSIGDEATARQSAVSTLTQNLNTEAQTRSYQDSQLANAIQGEAYLRGQSDNQIRQDFTEALNEETAARINGDSTLSHNLNVEAQARANAILNEATLRQGEDYQLRLQINGLSMDFDQLLEDVRQLMQNYKPIVINGNVTNAPDENDLTTTSDNLLKFKDNAYNPIMFSGMGKKFLRKNIRTLSDSYPFDGFVEDINPQEVLSGTPAKIFWDREGERFVGWVDGVYYLAWTNDDAYVPVSTENIYMYDGNPYKWNGEDFYVDDEELPNVRNVLTQDMIAESNTIYIIRYDYDLKSRELNVQINANDVIDINVNKGYTYYASQSKVELNPGECIILPNNTAILTSDRGLPVAGFYHNATNNVKRLYIESRTTDDVKVIIGQYINIPQDSVLYFAGGSIKNGGCNFQNSYLEGDVIFENVRCEGNILNTTVSPTWFGAKGDGITNDTLAIRSAIDVCDHIYFPSKTYLISCLLAKSYAEKTKHDEWGMVINRSGVTLDCNDAVFISDTFTDEVSYQNPFVVGFLISGDGCNFNDYQGVVDRINNVVINGGTFIGLRSQFNILTYTNNYENYPVISNQYAINTVFNGCKVQDATGDCVYQVGTLDTLFLNCKFSASRRFGVFLNTRSIIDKCLFDAPIGRKTYDNGNSSYGVPSYMAVGSENQSFESITNDNIHGWQVLNSTFLMKTSSRVSTIQAHDVIFENNYIETAVSTNGGVILGMTESQVENIIIRNNKFKQLGSGLIYAISAYKHTLIENNYFWNCTSLYLAGQINTTFRNNICDGDNPQITELAYIYSTANGAKTDYLIIENNKINNNVTIVKGGSSNLDDFNLILKNNIINYSGNFSYLRLFTSILNHKINVSVIGNKVYSGESEYFDLFTNTYSTTQGYALIQNNEFNIKSFFSIASNNQSNNCDIINNVINSSASTFAKIKTSESFTKKLGVVGNIFKGAITDLTEVTQSTANVIVENNVKI